MAPQTKEPPSRVEEKWDAKRTSSVEATGKVNGRHDRHTYLTKTWGLPVEREKSPYRLLASATSVATA